ncbi:MAG: hypothetical protein NVS1B7_2790 [Candidatus Saccharimonadales bacterium]
MVCIYCAQPTRVINSRHQKRSNQVWRRRKCSQCQAIFTTLESIDTFQSIRLRRKTCLEPFSRDTLLIGIYDSLKHRTTASNDATGLTATVMGNILPLIRNAVVERRDLIEVVGLVLERFDNVAATHYRAFHKIE